MSGMNSDLFIKPLAVAVCAAAGDKFILGEQNMQRNMYFGASAGLGVAVAMTVAPMIELEKLLPSNTAGMSARTLELRLLEIGGAVGVGFALNRFVLNNDPYAFIQPNKLFVLAASEVAGELITDFISGRKIDYFA